MGDYRPPNRQAAAGPHRGSGEPPGPSASPGDVRSVLEEMARRGWGPVLGLAVGARALAQSSVPVRSSLLLVGPTMSGKTLSASMALAPALSPGWPPQVDGTLCDTVAALELKLGRARDRATVIDDAGVDHDRRRARLLSRILEAAAAGEPIRPEVTRSAERRTAKGILVACCEVIPEPLPPGAFRHVVLAELRRGDNDATFYDGRHVAQLGPALRWVGHRVVDTLAGAPPGRRGEWVTRCDEAGAVALAPHVAGLATSEAMAGPLHAAGQMIGGLFLIEDACQVDVDALARAVAGPLATSLGRQAARIA